MQSLITRKIVVNYLGWQQYRGRLLPRKVVESLIEPHVTATQTRLKMGEKVRLRIDEDGETTFIAAVVADVSWSNAKGVSYALALPATPDGEFYIVSDGFSGTGIQIHGVESAEASGIYNELDFELYLRQRHATRVANARTNLSLVTAVIGAQMQHEEREQKEASHA
jgi:hypothetical protein